MGMAFSKPPVRRVTIRAEARDSNAISKPPVRRVTYFRSVANSV